MGYIIIVYYSASGVIMGDGFDLFEFAINICTLLSFIIFSFLGISFALISIFKNFTQILNKFEYNLNKTVDCKSKNQLNNKKLRNIKLSKNS